MEATDLDVCVFMDAPDLDDILLDCATEKDATDFLNCRFSLTFD